MEIYLESKIEMCPWSKKKKKKRLNMNDDECIGGILSQCLYFKLNILQFCQLYLNKAGEGGIYTCVMSPPQKIYELRTVYILWDISQRTQWHELISLIFSN